MLSLAVDFVGGLPHTTMSKWEKLIFSYDEKQIKINEPPGWNWFDWDMLSGYSGAMSMVSCCIAPVDGTQEQRDWRRSSWEASSAATWHYGLCRDWLSCEKPGPTWHEDVECRMERVRLVAWAITSERSRLTFLFSMPHLSSMDKRIVESCG